MSDLATNIAETKAEAERANADLLTTFSFVPDDRLAWSPGGEARSALWLVAHCGVSNEAFAKFLRGERPDFPSDPQEMMALLRNGGRDAATREEAIALVETSVPKILAALDTVTEERLGSYTETPFGPLPFTLWIEAARTHSRNHARQLDYLQTIWGDIEDHR